MKLLLDTHTFLFAIDRPNQLSPRMRRLLADPQVERWVSAVSLWEIAVKIHAGKLAMPLDRSYYIENLAALGARVLPVEFRHSLALLQLPVHHGDPFDRLLIAQAREEGLTLASRDGAFGAYDVVCIW